MAFVPDAPTRGRFVPDAPTSPEDQLTAGMRRLEQIQPGVTAKPVPAPSLGQRILGAGEAGLSLASGTLAVPFGMATGLGKLFTSGDPSAAIQQGMRTAQQGTYEPRTPAGRSALTAVGEGLASLPPYMGGITGLEGMIGPASGAAAQAGRKLAGAPLTAARKVAEVPGAIKGAFRTATGAEVPAARLAAAEASKTAVKSAATGIVQREKALDSVRKALETKLQLSQRVPPDLNVQGTTIRGAFTGAMDAAKTARSTEADTLFAQSRAEAAAKEAAGQRVDTAGAEKALNNMIDKAQGIPDLEAGLKKMLSAIKGRPPEPVEAPQILSAKGVPLPPTTPAAPAGKTFDQLELTRRYLNDIGYGSDLEGYPAILRKEARDAAKEIDAAMQKFSPGFAKYKERYAQMSEPLHSLGTRFGKAVTGTEGGLHEDAYAKVAASDLPNRLFAKREGVDLLVDALAGGKTATKEARATAQKQVDTMVENWILEQTRGKKPSAALESLAAPGMRSTLTAAPSVESKLRGQFGQQAGYERTIEAMTKAGKAPPMSTETATKMRDKLTRADALLTQASEGSKKQALQLYEETLSSARNARLIPADKYKAAMDLIDRANTLEEKTARAKKIAKWFGFGSAVVIAPEVAKHL